MDKKIGKLVRIYMDTEQKLLDELGELKQSGSECSCRNSGETLKFIHEGEFDEIIKYCLNCGGVTE